MKRLITLLLALIVCSSLAAETVVKGRVFEGKGKKTVEFANVGIYRSDNKLVGACASDCDGNFEIKVHKDGDYQVLVSFLGCGSWTKKIHCTGGELDLGKISLKEDNEELNAAGISAKTLIKRESDRIVYDVSADPDAARMNMSAFMSKVPGLKMSVKNGDLEFRNEPLDKILIDNKDNGMINKSRQYPMSFIRADYMSKIELILPNSPEYNNSSPMVVITLSKPLPYGAAGQIKEHSTSFNSHSATPDAVINTPLIGIGLRYSFNYASEPSTTNEYSRTSFDSDGHKTSVMDGSDYAKSNSRGHNLNMNLFRSMLKDKANVSASISANTSDSKTHSRSNTETLSYGSNTTSSSSSERTSYSPFRLNAGFKANYEWKRGNDITIKYTLKNSDSDINETLTLSDGDRANHSSKSDRQQNVSVKARLRPNRKIGMLLESGYMFRDYDDKTTYWNGDTGGMNYTQGVAYSNAVILGSLFKRKLGYSAAFNAERITNRGVNLLTSKSLDYDEINFIPQLSLSWSFLNDYRVWASYTSRSRRPRQDQLDPYIDTSDPYNIKTGNPDLKGENTHSFSGSIDRNFKAKWIDYLSVNADYSITPNSIEIVSKVNDNNVRTTSYENIGEHSVLSISLLGAFKPLEIFNINFKASYKRAHYQVSGNEINNISTFSLTQSASLNMKFAYLSQSLIIYPAGMSAQSKALRPEPLMDLSISKYWGKAHFGGTIGVEDVLHSRSHRKSTLRSNDFLQESWIQRAGRKIYISVYWRIGKFKQTETVKHTSYDLD